MTVSSVCGSYAGYRRHKRHQESVCDPCRQAYRVYQRQNSRRTYQRRRATRDISASHSVNHALTALRADLDAPWREQAACAGLHMEPAPGTAAERAARDLCRGCPVLQQCWNWAIDMSGWADPGGICAGLNEQERINARRARTARSSA